jgi:peptidoglycan/xylan/chitin deacetylase (PgdA/CDA1 family)
MRSLGFGGDVRAFRGSAGIAEGSSHVRLGGRSGAGLEEGSLNPRIVALTFDDGYVDNLTTAKPLLDAADVPATVFLITGRLGAREEFWWDELAHMCLCGAQPVEEEVEIAGRTYRFNLSAQSLSKSDGRKERERTYFELWSAMRWQDEASRAADLKRLRRAFGKVAPDSSNLPMCREDAQLLAENGLISIGAHTRTHPLLTGLLVAERSSEIELSRRDCESLGCGEVTGFAYPHGDLDAGTKAIVREAGFAWAVSTRSAAIDPRHYDLFDLPRLQVQNWTGTELMDALAQLTSAPRSETSNQSQSLTHLRYSDFEQLRAHARSLDSL